MVISTFYLPGSAANIQYQYAPTGGVYAGQRKSSAMTSTVRWWLLGIARPQVRILPGAHRHRSQAQGKRYPRE
jgi:hypothetical protein